MWTTEAVGVNVLIVISPLHAAELAGMASREGSGPLGAAQFPPQAGTRWHVELDGDRLLWAAVDPFDPNFSPSAITSFDGALDLFILVKDSDDVLRFAQRFGVLGICEHGLPSGFNRGCPDCRTRLSIVGPCVPRQCEVRRRAKESGRQPWVRCGAHTSVLVDYEPTEHGPKRIERKNRIRDCWLRYVHHEPVQGWLTLAQLATSTVSVAAAVHQNSQEEPEGWEILWRMLRTYAYAVADAGWYEKPPFTQEEGRRLVGASVGWWLDIAGVRPIFWWDALGAHVEFWGGTFGALGLQLVRAVGRAGAISVCSACGATYVRPNRRAQKGRRNYCPSCGDKAGNRLRQDVYRSKRKRRAAEERLEDGQEG